MKIRTLSRALSVALLAGGAVLLAPASVHAEEAAQPAEQVTAATLEESGIFTAQTVETRMKQIIDLFDRGDVAALQSAATPAMQTSLTAEQINNAKAQFAQKWGARVSFGKAYMTAVRQGDEWFAVGEIAVGYKATSVVYRISFDRSMQVAGFFIR